jgi:hypothetical protein
MEKDLKFTFVSLWKLNDWGLYNRRNEALLRELSQRDSVERVLHVEHLSFKGLIYICIQWLMTHDLTLKKTLGLHIKKGFSLRPVLLNDNQKYYVSSVIELYSGDSYWLNRLNSLVKRIQYGAINDLFATSEGKVVFVAYPPYLSLAGSISGIRHDILISDLVDDDIEITRDPKKKEEYLNIFKKVLPGCHWICATSASLNEKYREIAKKDIHFLPNGVNAEDYSVDRGAKAVMNNGRKTVGYVGAINKAMDTELLEHAVSLFPSVDFVLIGFCRAEQIPDITRLSRNYSNFKYYGERSYHDIPGYLRSFDVLISFKKADYSTAGNDSMKIYQYLATGNPVVTTPVPPAERFKELVYLACDKYQFADCLKAALEEDDGALRERRKAEARKNSWAKRVDVILENVSKIAAKTLSSQRGFFAPEIERPPENKLHNSKVKVS